MGCELAQDREWSHERSLDWHLLEDAGHAGVQRLRATSTTSTATRPRCGTTTSTRRGSTGWRPTTPSATSSPSRGRRAITARCWSAQPSPVLRENYRVGLPRSGRWREALNTDSAFYGGADWGNLGGVDAEPVGWHEQPCSAELVLGPLSVLWLVPE